MLPAVLLAFAALLLSPIPILAQTQAPMPATGCSGCQGSGGSAAASGGACNGVVSISVTVTSGKCRWYMGEAEDISCRQQKSCQPEVTRSWSGLLPSTELDFCLEMEGESLCLWPKPSSGSHGAGLDTRISAGMACSNDTAGSRQFSVASAACGLSATAQAACSTCSGSF